MVFMGSVKLNIFGQVLQLADQDDNGELYRTVASELNEELEKTVSKLQLRSEIKAAVQVAFKLALENKQYKEKLAQYENMDNKIDSCLSKLEEI